MGKSILCDGETCRVVTESDFDSDPDYHPDTESDTTEVCEGECGVCENCGICDCDDMMFLICSNCYREMKDTLAYQLEEIKKLKKEDIGNRLTPCQLLKFCEGC